MPFCPFEARGGRETNLISVDRSSSRSIRLVDLGVVKFLELGLDDVVGTVGEGSNRLVVLLTLNDDGLVEAREGRKRGRSRQAQLRLGSERERVAALTLICVPEIQASTRLAILGSVTSTERQGGSKTSILKIEA